MSSSLLTFRNKYYKYNGGASVDEKGLAIGGYESAFLVDLVAAYLFDLCSDNFNITKFYSIYRDDGIIVFRGKWTTCHIADWLKKFQSHVNTIVGNAHLIFTALVWTNSPYDSNLDKISLICDNRFLYLDMELYWDKWNNLKTRVYWKPNQALKYIS